MHTDHDPLVQLEMVKVNSGNLVRWFLWLQELDFELEHVPGKDNVVANALSHNVIAAIRTCGPHQIYLPKLARKIL